MTDSPDALRKRLIEEWLPVDAISIESIRERSAASALPPINWLHVWWARRPLTISRAAVAASLLDVAADRENFLDLLGTHSGVVAEQRRLDAAKAEGTHIKSGYSRKRAFTYSPSNENLEWFDRNLAVDSPLIADVTAGGGSIPFEAGRLGLRTIANELNPVATLILRATCKWPQRYGAQLIESFDGIDQRFRTRVKQSLNGVYPQESRPEPAKDQFEINRPRRNDQTFLWARTIRCPSCESVIPLSPNWRLDSRGAGLQLLPNSATGRCDFKLVEKSQDQSLGTIKGGIATCPYPNCGSSTRKSYVAEEAEAGRLGHQLYCVIYRDQSWPLTKSGRPRKRPKTSRGYRTPNAADDNSDQIKQRLRNLQPKWDAENILPSEAVPFGNDNRPITYGMTPWRNMFSPRQQLAHGHCVQAFRELVDEDRVNGELDEVRQIAWCYLALGLDKLLHYNNLLSRWHPGREVVASIFDSHDFGMKYSYTEMAVTIDGLGLDWALNDMRSCIQELTEMCGQSADVDRKPESNNDYRAVPTESITSDSAELLLSLDDRSVDAIVFDPPYYDNVAYAELSDFFYVWLKRTVGYIRPDWFSDHLTNKINEAIASQARFKNPQGKPKRTKSIKTLAYEDYVARMRNVFSECRRVLKDDGILTIMFTHKSTDAWDALTIGIIEAGFRITATWPIKTESDSSLNIRDRAAARSTILLACRPKTGPKAAESSWERIEDEIAFAVRDRIPTLTSYGLRPLDVYLAAFGPALEVISANWPIRRELANPDRGDDPFAVTPNDALQVARREVFAARRSNVSQLWADNPGDHLTEFYILAQDATGSTTMPFDEANLIARCIGLDLSSSQARSIYEKKNSRINLLTAGHRFAQGKISPNAPSARTIDLAHTAIALSEIENVNVAIEWCERNGLRSDPALKGTLEALLRIMRVSDPDRRPAQTLWSEMYREESPNPDGRWVKPLLIK